MKTFPQEVLDFANSMMRSTASATQTGINAERSALLPLFDDIFKAYRRALGDPAANLPPELHSAMANAQRVVGDLRKGMDEHKQVLGADALVREAA